MKKYLLSGLFIFIFAFIYQLEISQSQSRDRFRPLAVDGECHNPNRHNGLLLDEQDLNREVLCNSGSFSLIEINKETRIISYACSGSFGGASVFCSRI